MSLKSRKNKLQEEINNLKFKLEKAEFELASIKSKVKSTAIPPINEADNALFDISDENLDISQKAFSQLFESMVQGFALHKMIYKDGEAVNYKFLLINKAFEKLTGLKRDDVIGKTVLDVMPNTEPVWIKNSAKVAESGTSLHFENFSQELNKTYDVVSFCPRKGYFATVFTDVTLLKNTEKELLKAKNIAEESNKLKTMFLNNMSHEIRTPLNVIIGFTKLLSTKRNISEDQRNEYNKMIIESGDQLVKTIEDILEISSLETQQSSAAFEPFSINELIDEVVNTFKANAETKKLPILISKELSYENSYLISDRVKLSKVLRNTISNALKYTSNGSIDISYKTKDDLLEFKIKDTGIGIENADQNFIFERFSQENNQVNKFLGGLGIGLAIAKENIRILGGTISYSSELNVGSEFTFTIPYFRKELKEELKVSTPTENILKDKKRYTILIAEDEDLNFKFLKIMLSKNDVAEFDVLRAHNGQEAVDICQSNNEIDLVLMDIQMPVLNGNDATKKIKLNLPSLPIIAQSAYTSRNDIEKMKEHGCDDFIPKPLDSEILFKKILDLLK